jgi:DNA segregation ATPase FtsK/SpoIIIE, S-DNA-T family
MAGFSSLGPRTSFGVLLFTGRRTVMKGRTAPDSLPEAPVTLSMFDPIRVGRDEFGLPLLIKVIYKNLLAAGEPGSGKSGLMNTLTAYAALSDLSRLVLFDGKQVELGMWAEAADEFVGPDLDKAIITLRRLQRVMDNRYAWLKARRRRKIEPGDNLTVITAIFDEIALYSTVLGTEQQQREFITLLRDLVARGRAAGIIVIAATQRPSVDIIPKSLRDLFGYRAAFRCTSTGSSDIILGDGLSGQGYDATSILPTSPGAALIIAEGGTPVRMRGDYLSDTEISTLADFAVWKRNHGNPGRPALEAA